MSVEFKPIDVTLDSFKTWEFRDSFFIWSGSGVLSDYHQSEENQQNTAKKIKELLKKEKDPSSKFLLGIIGKENYEFLPSFSEDSQPDSWPCMFRGKDPSCISFTVQRHGYKEMKRFKVVNGEVHDEETNFYRRNNWNFELQMTLNFSRLDLSGPDFVRSFIRIHNLVLSTLDVSRRFNKVCLALLSDFFIDNKLLPRPLIGLINEFLPHIPKDIIEFEDQTKLEGRLLNFWEKSQNQSSSSTTEGTK